ncbi:MAG TPA: hypothetical protein VK689_09295, partial [Armatimonadota bacterium]|nr:hypothetical protein [Armatimonadota bacterium]
GAKLPSLQALEAASTEPTWTDRLRRLAAESGQPVLADYYRCRPSLWQMDDSKVVVAGKAVAAVDAFCMPSSYLWWTCGRSLLLRKRDWYDLRRYEVPDRWLLASLARLEARNWVLTYGDLGRVAELTPEQIAGLTGMVGRGSSVQESDIPSLRALLALVAAAPAAEETPAYSGALYEEVLERITFTYPRLNPAQRRLALAVAEEEHWPIAPEQMPRFFARACFAYGEPIRKAGKERYMQIVVNWGFGDARRAVDEGHAGLHLPASFPDDRRDRTKVEIVP